MYIYNFQIVFCMSMILKIDKLYHNVTCKINTVLEDLDQLVSFIYVYKISLRLGKVHIC